MTTRFRLTLTESEDGSYEIETWRNLDAHLSCDEDGWILSIFDSRGDDHVGVANVNLLPSGEIDWREVIKTLREFPI